MTQWMSGTIQLGAMILALFVLAQWPALADTVSGSDVSGARIVSVDAKPAHLGWMVEQHWLVVNGQ